MQQLRNTRLIGWWRCLLEQSQVRGRAVEQVAPRGGALRHVQTATIISSSEQSFYGCEWSRSIAVGMRSGYPHTAPLRDLRQRARRPARRLVLVPSGSGADGARCPEALIANGLRRVPRLGVAEIQEDERERWMTPGVRGIRSASLMTGVGHEVPTAPLPQWRRSWP
jgi:hypothetical protein